MCKRSRRVWSCRVAVIASILLAAQSLYADEEEPFVSLILTEASAELDSNGDTLFTCEIKIANSTKEDLVVESRFNSALDGLALVVTNIDGRTLAQQGYTYHQSPRAELKKFVLKKGESKTTLVFPLSHFAADERLKVRLVGFLPGSSYGRILSTDTKTISVKGPATDGK